MFTYGAVASVVAPGLAARIRYQIIESGTGAAAYYVDVDRQHLVPEVRQADGVGEPEVPGPDDGNPRQ